MEDGKFSMKTTSTVLLRNCSSPFQQNTGIMLACKLTISHQPSNLAHKDETVNWLATTDLFMVIEMLLGH